MLKKCHWRGWKINNRMCPEEDVLSAFQVWFAAWRTQIMLCYSFECCAAISLHKNEGASAMPKLRREWLVAEQPVIRHTLPTKCEVHNSYFFWFRGPIKFNIFLALKLSLLSPLSVFLELSREQPQYCTPYSGFEVGSHMGRARIVP